MKKCTEKELVKFVFMIEKTLIVFKMLDLNKQRVVFFWEKSYELFY